MIIGFWSEQAGRGSATYNMLASAMGFSTRTRNNVVLMQGKKDYNRIEYAFTPYEGDGILKEDYGYYNYGGMDAVINKLATGNLDENSYIKELVRINKSNLYYLRTGASVGNDGFYRHITNAYEKYIRFLKESNSINFIELASGFEGISGEYLNMFDVFVVNISQDGKELRNILGNSWLKDNAVFIVGSYDSESEYNISNIQREHSITSDRIGILPYSIKFRDAVCAGKCIEFFDRHRDDKREDSEYELIKNINYISDMLLKRCEIG